MIATAIATVRIAAGPNDRPTGRKEAKADVISMLPIASVATPPPAPEPEPSGADPLPPPTPHRTRATGITVTPFDWPCPGYVHDLDLDLIEERLTATGFRLRHRDRQRLWHIAIYERSAP
jgi:hypothetical protein